MSEHLGRSVTWVVVKINERGSHYVATPSGMVLVLGPGILPEGTEVGTVLNVTNAGFRREEDR